jgi:hypothetical protein
MSILAKIRNLLCTIRYIINPNISNKSILEDSCEIDFYV